MLMTVFPSGNGPDGREHPPVIPNRGQGVAGARRFGCPAIRRSRPGLLESGKKLPHGGAFLPIRHGRVFVKPVFVPFFTWYGS
jgi:hypothetical protein